MEKIYVSAVTNLIIDISNKVDVNLTNLKLQKILFFINGIYYSVYDKLLFTEEMRAWKYGPIIPEIYYEFKIFGSDSLNNALSYVYDPEADEAFPSKINNSFKEYSFLETTLKFILNIPVYKLVDMSHLEESPWHRCYNDENLSDVIKFENKDKNFFENFVLAIHDQR